MSQRYFILYFLLALATLACGLSGSAAEEPLILNRLPTLTPTPGAGAPPAVLQSNPVEAAPPLPGEAVEVPPPAEAPPVEGEVQPEPAAPAPATAPEPPPSSSTTAVSETPGWSFVRTQLYPNPADNNLILYGEMINETGSPQQVIFVSGNFFDAQGQLLADAASVDAYWPVETIPAGGRMPIELTVNGFQEAASYTLNVQAEPSTVPPRQDFEFVELNATNAGDVYCVTGQLRNPGEPLQEYLIFIISLYNDAGNVVNFSHQFEANFTGALGEQNLPFEICIGAANLPEVVDYGIQAWGR